MFPTVQLSFLKNVCIDSSILVFKLQQLGTLIVNSCGKSWILFSMCREISLKFCQIFDFFFSKGTSGSWDFIIDYVNKYVICQTETSLIKEYSRYVYVTQFYSDWTFDRIKSSGNCDGQRNHFYPETAPKEKKSVVLLEVLAPIIWSLWRWLTVSSNEYIQLMIYITINHGRQILYTF